MNKVLSKLINKALTNNKMRKGNDVIGKVVVTYNTGEKIERIRDLIFDHKRNQLLGFLVEEKRLFRDAKVIALQDVQAIGLDAIVVHSNKSVVRARAIPAIKEILSHNNVLIGTKILTTEGLDLGRLVDLFFDEHSGLVEGYEVSGGVFADAYSGRSFVPAPETLNIGYDVAFVPPETAQMMEAQVGGIRGAIQATEDKFQSSVENVNLGLKEASQSAAQQLQAATDATSSKLQNLNRDALTSVTNNLVDHGGSLSANIKRNLQPVIESTKNRIQNAAQGSLTNFRSSVDVLAAHQLSQQAIGHRVLQTLRAEDGLIIAASGQIVTQSILDRAQTYGKEAQLLNAVGLTLETAVHSTATNTWLETKVQMRERSHIAQDNLNTFWQTLQNKAQEIRGQSTRAINKHRVEQALGRPVIRVILDPEDKVILNVGELITHRAVHQAEESGVLNILLSSVYFKNPEIYPHELRAQEHGMAGLAHHGNGRAKLEAESVSDLSR